MAYQNVILQREGPLAVLTVNRPGLLNALNNETLKEIGSAVEEVRNDQTTSVLIITGAGDRAFVAGADISFMQNMSAAQGRAFGLLGQRVFRSIENLELPVIAAINGYALGGGCELALACDFRIASERARFGQPEVGLGVTPGFGGTQRLPRTIGCAMAKQLLFTGDVIDAAEALRIGLVNAVVPHGELMSYVKGIAGRIAQQGQIAVRYCKAAVNEGMQTDVDRGMTIEADLFGLCFATADQKEGMTAFMEKRPALFHGR